MRFQYAQPDPKLDLVLERVVDVPRELVWAAWTKPEHLKVWFTPRPWTVSAILALDSEGTGTRYTATALHRDEAGRKQHEAMGFHEGWGKALDQLVAYAETM